MDRKTIVLIGRSGCGKGTQADLLNKYIKENDDSSRDIFYMEIGEKFRNLIKGDGFASRLSKEISEEGDLQPEFLAVHLWSDEFVNNIKGEEHLIIDGTPRKPREAKVFDSAMKFFNRGKVDVIHLNVSRDWAFDKLSKRGREDDKEAKDINKRLDWFDEEVTPTIEFFKNNSDYIFHDVSGEDTIEKVHENIVKSVF